jgi:outer membrane protein OmpA-like peptidoglycan-associated protein/tetratricopeptide (TPR) repeat protein
MNVKRPLNNTIILITFVAFLASCSNGYIKSGDKDFENFSYAKAITKYEKALKGQPDNLDVKLKLADSHRKLNQSEEAEVLYSQVADSIPLPTDEQLNYAEVLMKNNKYDNAKVVLQSYLKERPNDQLAKDLLASTENVNELKEDTSAYVLTALPLDFTVSMFGPSHYKDGIIFAGETEIVSAATTNPWTGYSFLDMFYIQKDNGGNWDIAESFSPILNGRFHDGPASFNGKEDFVVYTRSAMKNEKKQLVNENNENQFYLYSSNLVDGEWEEPKQLSFNSMAYSVGHPSLTEDGKTLYFSSDMPGGYGGSDIYKSSFDGNEWTTPINLGSTINTSGNEVFPYIAKNGDLYFSSQGHQTLGGLDVFVSQKRSGVWTKPVNLAYPLNSSQDDFALILDEGDTTGYVSSNRSGIDMIYAYAKVPPVFTLDGTATLKSTGNPIEGVIITLINETDADSARITTSQNGKFHFNLLPSKKYTVKGEKPTYFTVSQTFETRKNSTEENINLVFDLDEIVTSDPGTGSGGGSGTGAGAGTGTGANKTYDIGDIFYDYNKSEIRPDAKPTLNKLVTMLKDNPSIKIEIQSHSDCRGTAEYNLKLSDRRAAAVVNYLVKNGISKSRLTSKGFGEANPINGCTDGVKCTDAEYQENRRTEFIVLK